MSAAPVGYRPVATLDDVARGEFVTRVYQHVLAALVAFVAFEALLINCLLYTSDAADEL